ncbi:MAG: sel1 repeat family protein [Treponema sp.]|nr:sel1 repeat family protein [Treponema sp.]
MADSEIWKEQLESTENADFEKLVMLANSGNGAAMHKLGDVYKAGAEIETNNERAKYWYEQSIKAFNKFCRDSYVDDEWRDTYVFYNRYVLNEKLGNREIALEELVRCANVELEEYYDDDYRFYAKYKALAQTKLALWYLQGNGRVMHIKKALVLFKNAFETDMSLAERADVKDAIKLFYVRIADMFKADSDSIKDNYYGSETEKKRKFRNIALQFYEKAADNGDVDAYYGILKLNDEAGTERISEKLHSLGKLSEDDLLALYEKHGNKAKIAEILEKRAERGTAEEKWNLGVKFAGGKDIPRDMDKAISWHEKAAAESENADWFLKLGNWFNDGEYTFDDDYDSYSSYSINRNAERAAMYLEKAVSLGKTEADGTLFELYKELEKTDKIAEVLEKRAENGTAEDKWNSGLKYAKGEDVPKNAEKAAKWLEIAASSGKADWQWKLGNMYADEFGNSEKAVFWLEKAASQGDIKMQYELALRYADGDGIKADETKAKEWFLKSAEGGDKKACVKIAEIYEEEKDFKKAGELYMKAGETEKANRCFLGALNMKK